MSQPSPYETVISSAGFDAEWDEFVLVSPTAHHEQTTRWGEAQRFAGWPRALRVMVKQDGKLVGGAQVLEKPLGRFGWTVGYLNRGPLAATDDPALRQTILEAVKRHARQRRMVYLAVVLPYDGEKFCAELPAAGFAVSPDSLPPTTSMSSTIVADLSPDEDALIMAMRKTTRQNIKKGLKLGWTARWGGVEDLETFKRLLTVLCERRGVRANIPMNGFLLDLWEKFAPKGRVRLLIAEKDGEPVVTLLMFSCGQWVRAWRYGWSGAHADDYPNEFIYWEAMRSAKAAGFRYFDFVGFDTKDAQAVLQGRVLPPGERCAMSYAKQGFGGTVQLLYPRFCHFPNPVIRTLFNLVGARLLKTGLIKYLEKLASKRA